MAVVVSVIPPTIDTHTPAPTVPPISYTTTAVLIYFVNETAYRRPPFFIVLPSRVPVRAMFWTKIQRDGWKCILFVSLLSLAQSPLEGNFSRILLVSYILHLISIYLRMSVHNIYLSDCLLDLSNGGYIEDRYSLQFHVI